MFLNQGNILQSLREYPDRHILVFPRNIATFFRSLSKKKRGSDSPFRRRTAGPPRYKDRWDAYEPANALEIEAAYQASQSFSLFRCLLATTKPPFGNRNICRCTNRLRYSRERALQSLSSPRELTTARRYSHRRRSCSGTRARGRSKSPSRAPPRSRSTSST